MRMGTIKELLIDHLQHTFEREAWQPPLGNAVKGLTATQAAWKPSGERHSIWQIVRHLIRWKQGTLEAWSGDKPDFQQLTLGDWQEASGDQAAWDADVQQLFDLHAEFHRRLAALGEEDLLQSVQWFQQASRPQPLAPRLMHAFTHDSYHAGQIQYLRALQQVPIDRFMTAMWDGNGARLAEMLEALPDLLRAYSPDGWTAVQIAAYAGHVEILRLLLARGADVRAISENAMATTALHVAVTGWRAPEGRAEVITLLLDHGADVNARQKDGATPLGTALKGGQAAIADLVRKQGGVE